MMPGCSTKGLWRLIDTGPLDGVANMALDEALLECFDPESSSPVIRFYGWTPPALSLGRYQDAAAVLDLERCAAHGIPVVRRITGGGVIYHTEELTYSIVCSPAHIPQAHTVKETFEHLCSFILEGYRRLGLDASFAVHRNPLKSRLGERSAFCFAGKEEYDIVVDGRKVGGNAQRRQKGKIFQHGSIPLRSAFATALPFLREQPAGLDAGTASLAELGIRLPDAELKKLLAASFKESLGVGLEEDILTAAERERAESLSREKYGLAAWNVK